MRTREHYLALARPICAKVDALAAITEMQGGLTRRYLTPQHRRANDLVLGWMRDAGMAAEVDAVGNVVGRYEGQRPGAPALLLGSHLDTVRNAGKYDGMLGVITAIACVDALNRQGERLDHAIEVLGFGDEEGVRFQSTLLGSRAVAGTLTPSMLEAKDRDGTSVKDALVAFGLDPSAIAGAARKPENVVGYVELHIEQGPVLESLGLPVGTVTAIASLTRFMVEYRGEAGHAGTVPMGLRRDALAGAAEAVLAIESLARGEDGLVGTVGRLEASPGAGNVIPGAVNFSVDLRGPTDAQRKRAEAGLTALLADIAKRRHLDCTVTKTLDEPAAVCAPWIMDQIDRAIAAHGIAVHRLPSGAGHDGSAIVPLAGIGMVFVRCRKGISHNPAEAVEAEDIGIGCSVLMDVIRRFKVPGRA